MKIYPPTLSPTHPHAGGKLSEVATKIVLENHSKTALQYSPKQLKMLVTRLKLKTTEKINKKIKWLHTACCA